MLRGLFFALCALLSGFVSCERAHAYPLGEPYETEARQTMQAIQKQKFNFPKLTAQLEKVWNQKCEKVNPSRPCRLNECDLKITGFRKDHVLLFRGEDQKFEWPSMSSLVRTHWQNSAYGFSNGRPLDALQLLKRLRLDLALFGRTTGAPQGTPFLLDRDLKTGSRRWSMSGRDISFWGHFGDRDDPALVFTGMLRIFHDVGSYFFFNDPDLGQVCLDPLVSYSASVMTAIGTNREKGRVMILSVPKSELVTDCPQQRLVPGSILSFTACQIKNQFLLEREYDAVLYPNPKYIFQIPETSP